MKHSRSACGVACVCAAGLAGVLASACDPKETPPVSENGPPFLLVGRADTQPSWSNQGTNVYVQARGGNLLAIELSGCTGDVADFVGSTRSCAILPYYGSQAFNFPIHTAVDEPCVISARLYSVCDCPEAGSPADYQDGPSAFAWCEAAGTLVATERVAVDPWLPSLTVGDGGEGDASAPAADGGSMTNGDGGVTPAPVSP